MKMIKMALLGGAAMAVTAASAQADDLDALKAQIEQLNARVAAMETAPSVPAGYQLLAVSEGELQATPGLGFTARERAAYGNRSTIISVLPTADAPAGTTISWSGYARAGLVYGNTDNDLTATYTDANGAVIKVRADASKSDGFARDANGALILDANGVALMVSDNEDGVNDADVKARGQLRVKATTDTAVGEVGVDLRLRGNFNGNGDADVYMDVAWGYWAMTPELTFGGGYAGSLGNIGYGYDGACTCYYTDNADLAFNPGDTSQMRLSYASGPFSMGIALEDASGRAPGFGANDNVNVDRLGAAGEVKYSGDMFSGEISGVWRDIDEDSFTGGDPEARAEDVWQVGMGVGFALGDIANLSLAAAMGEGPFLLVDEGVLSGNPLTKDYNQSWWGITGLASMKVSDEVHLELAAGYKNREGDEATFTTGLGETMKTDGVEYDTYGVLAGVYYTPVDQLTIGVEGEWYTVDASLEATGNGKNAAGADLATGKGKIEVDNSPDTYSVDLVAVWRF